MNVLRFVLAYYLSVAILLSVPVYSQSLKSIIYDFEGFDLNSSFLPEGDYNYGDLVHSVAANPLSPSGILGDRVLEMKINWNAGYGAFGRGISRYIELNASKDILNFYFYNPPSNGQPAVCNLKIADDDNQSNAYESNSDDNWEKQITIHTSPNWQLISVPLNDFSDGNSGGNGVFDIAYSQNKGMLLLLEFRFNKNSTSPPLATYYLDMICISDGQLPTGTTILDLPARNATDYCLLGAHRNELPGEYFKIPEHFEGMFPATPVRKIKYAHTYMPWGTNGTANAHALPGIGLQTLINNGYTPILTWEPRFNGFGMLDPQQPRLDDIINGNFNSYLDNFGDKMKTYTDTIIVRLMHEFDGDWYPWSISQNNYDGAKFALAFETIVQRVRSRGATKIKWMWCPNNYSSPSAWNNWIVSAYPGDSYVDIVGTDVYNAHYPLPIPWWRSFRWQTAEVYYYLTTHFPNKPLFICEMASRERFSNEPATSESKGEWLEKTDKELQSFFSKSRALIFFDENKNFQWHVNSSPEALQSLQDNFWNDDYYFEIPLHTGIGNTPTDKDIWVYPNPSQGEFKIKNKSTEKADVTITDVLGKLICKKNLSPGSAVDVRVQVSAGLYFIHISLENRNEIIKMVVE
jgi:hypothetical protein